ncbi:substrate-binding domain-containing protein [Acinetobacter junii]|jgi:phosphate transport system substrate-binding protein|uniref:Substrate-binding domain-containing protein n=1 Tax=Acinetobacter junii TaxID=40215 RepID=A0AAW5RBF9_ACIJU|nr:MULTISPECIES: substrate-binding domain-containing protein [Acinetobacter]APU49328.1 phosphonate ABC transporter substrate-binding protein [Acinetobacter junii]AWA47437.1 phosphonate ABC transporter substrate-binding protein [Acinetobacter junii]MBL8282746.1 substrate-binding domain-containing protein [Acinetobacter junii]MCE6005414.1 substrate-binding domain-containing protein [Acinetobacter junii]MCU4396228.1 substrate-binding domain-containing protein [Acinetobacter junii]
MRLNTRQIVIALAVSGAVVATTANAARDTIQIAGSSTVLPYASIVAEEFGNTFPQFKAPVVGSGGSSAGLKQFCQGLGDNTIDIANSSRKIKDAELAACKKAGVTQIQEIKIGYDGIVFASNLRKRSYELDAVQVFQALAAQLPSGGKLIPNPYTRWSQIDSELPDEPITLVIPASNHGTREVFQEKLVDVGCESFAYFKNLEKDDQKKACSSFRKDGRVIEIAGDYTETLTRLKTSPNAIGVFGLGFYDQNRDKLRVATVNGVMPNENTILSGRYPVSRALYFYVKGQHLKSIKGLPQYVEFFLNKKFSGKGSKLEKAGLIPLSDKERAKILADFKAGKTVK